MYDVTIKHNICSKTTKYKLGLLTASYVKMIGTLTRKSNDFIIEFWR